MVILSELFHGKYFWHRNSTVSPLHKLHSKNELFVDFAGGRSDDGVFLAENPWEDPEIESAIMEDNFLKLKEIIEQMNFTDSDDENVVPQSRERQGSSSEPAGQSESMGTLHG